ncbi:MAG: hypothetical protein BWK73_33270 [Thiothrix lacustris]|uniref:Uncharacterized protein n=1 Tax=Thiothrix lacustris TaxID=525917 RepID=A0A1Y1QH73_9GAMM|nr:MAG: hypothetical protein BWK73_33270 [Thiothrix lacustris]
MKLLSFTKWLVLCLLIGSSTLIGGCGGNGNKVSVVVLVPALGKIGDKIPKDLVKFCEPLQTGKETSYPIVSFKRIDIEQETNLVGSWWRKLVPVGGKSQLDYCKDALSGQSIPPDFSNEIPPNNDAIKKNVEKYAEKAVFTYKISAENTMDKVVSDLQNRLAQDSATVKKLKYLVIYQPILTKSILLPPFTPNAASEKVEAEASAVAAEKARAEASAAADEKARAEASTVADEKARAEASAAAAEKARTDANAAAAEKARAEAKAAAAEKARADANAAATEKARTEAKAAATEKARTEAKAAAAEKARADAKAAATEKARAEAKAATTEKARVSGTQGGCSGDLNRAASLASSGSVEGKGKALAILNTLALELDTCTPSEKSRYQSITSQAK